MATVFRLWFSPPSCRKKLMKRFRVSRKWEKYSELANKTPFTWILIQLDDPPSLLTRLMKVKFSRKMALFRWKWPILRYFWQKTTAILPKLENYDACLNPEPWWLDKNDSRDKANITIRKHQVLATYWKSL